MESKLRKISNIISLNRREITEATEEQTKHSLIVPFIEALGYNTRDVNEVKWEYGIHDRKVDCVVSLRESAIIIECKKLGTKLNKTHTKQLSTYYDLYEARHKIAILTDGEVYKIYGDSKMPGRMDDEPFIEFKITSITNYDIEKLEQFNRLNFGEVDSGIEKIYDKIRKAFRDSVLNIIGGNASDIVIENILQNNEITQYKRVIDYVRIRSILKEVCDEVIDTKISLITKENTVRNIEKAPKMVDKVESSADEVQSDTNIEHKWVPRTVTLSGLSWSIKNGFGYKSISIDGKEIPIKERKDILGELVRYVIKLNINNIEKLEGLWNYKSRVYVTREEIDEKEKSSATYLNEYGVYVVSKLDIDDTIKYIKVLLEYLKLDESIIKITVLESKN